MIGRVTEAETRPADSEWVSGNTAPEAPPAATADVIDPANPSHCPRIGTSTGN